MISSKPWVMLDACINSASCDNVIDVLCHFSNSSVEVESTLNKSRIMNSTEKINSNEILKPTVIIGIPDDKDYMGVVKNKGFCQQNYFDKIPKSSLYIYYKTTKSFSSRKY